jgi:hypothetical protein
MEKLKADKEECHTHRKKKGKSKGQTGCMNSNR